MSSLLKMLTGRSRRLEARTRLFELSRDHQWVQVEIEATPLRFWSKILIRNETVVLNSHLEHEPYMKRKGWVRVRPDPQAPGEIRLRIESLRHGGSGALATAVGRMALLCPLRSGEAVAARRGPPRFFTGSHSEVELALPPDHLAFPLVDLSLAGMRVKVVDRKDFNRFPLRLPQHHAQLRLGLKPAILLESITPRHHHPHAVGLEMVLDPLDDGHHRLETFLDTLRWEERHPGD